MKKSFLRFDFAHRAELVEGRGWEPRLRESEASSIPVCFTQKKKTARSEREKKSPRRRRGDFDLIISLSLGGVRFF